MLVNVQVGGDRDNGTGGIIQEEDCPETAALALSPFARAGNLEAIYMMGIIKSYCHQDVERGICLLRFASSQGYVRSSYALGLVLRDSQPEEATKYMKLAAGEGYLPALQELLPAREMKAKFGEPNADELRRHLDPLCLNRLLGRHYVHSAELRELNTSHCWNPLCGRWAFKASVNPNGVAVRVRRPWGFAFYRNGHGNRIGNVNVIGNNGNGIGIGVANGNIYGNGNRMDNGNRTGHGARYGRNGIMVNGTGNNANVFVNGNDVENGNGNGNGNVFGNASINEANRNVDDGNEDVNGNNEVNGNGNDDGNGNDNENRNYGSAGDRNESGNNGGGGNIGDGIAVRNGSGNENSNGIENGEQHRGVALVTNRQGNTDGTVAASAADTTDRTGPGPPDADAPTEGATGGLGSDLPLPIPVNNQARISSSSAPPVDVRVSRMKMCSRCCRAKYCSKLCQVYDWRSGRHKMECQFL